MKKGTVTVLGSATSMGIPTIGCGCAVCHSSDPKDRRTRPSVMVEWEGHRIVIDSGPDFREQALRQRLNHVDAVFYTHAHADHILGMDDLRPLSFIASKRGAPIPLYADRQVAEVLERTFGYTFSPQSKYPTRARVRLVPLGDHNLLHGVDFIRIPLWHGEQAIVGYRFGNAAYMTDVSAIPESSFALLEGVEVLAISALRHTPHPSHSTVKQSLEWSRRVGARQTWFTHISHDLDHDSTNAELPAHIHLAHDGLKLNFEIA